MRFEQLPFSPELIEAAWKMGKLPSETVPFLAQTALELGYDGKYTREVAGLIRPNWSDLETLGPKFLSELGMRGTQSREDAARTLARFVAQAIVEGRVRPYDGARYIWLEIANALWPNTPKELVSFIGNASEYDDCAFYADHPDEVRRKIERDIVEDARQLSR